MTKLIWDQVSERLYETGLDRGVLYLSDGSGIPWNGLTSIEEDMGDDTTTPMYYDGVKYLDNPSIGDFAATLTALTYPTEFLAYEGVVNLGNGTYVDDQSSKPFGLSYRTKVGNAVVGSELGYKIHILYNLTATPGPMTRQTIDSRATPLLFSWKLSGIPEYAPYARPTAHVILDSRFLSSSMLAALEDMLYGKNVTDEPSVDGDLDLLDILDGGSATSSGTGVVDGDLVTTSPAAPATLPTLAELIDFISFWNPKRIIPQSVTGLADLVDGTGDLTETHIEGLFTALPTNRLEYTEIDGIYILGLGLLAITYLGNDVWTAEDAGGEYITMLDATTFEITSPSAVYLDADTYTISSHD